LKEFIYDFKYPEILLILSKQKGDSWPLLGAFPIPPVLLVVLMCAWHDADADLLAGKLEVNPPIGG
jgi:hypothetical protein